MNFDPPSRLNRSEGLHWHSTLMGLTVLLIPVAYLKNDLVQHQRLRPPSANCTLTELAAKVPPPANLVVVDRNGAKSLFWFGPEPPTVVSGPPCYIFDDSGRLLEWTWEMGEGWKFDDLANEALWSKKGISLSEAMDLFGKQKSK